jgi:hypothetical protein
VKIILGLALLVVLPFVVSLVACEVHGASPHFARRLTRLIARAVPALQRDLIEDQWYDDLRIRQDKGLRLWLFFVAFGFLISTATIRLDEWRSLTGNQRYGRFILAMLYTFPAVAFSAVAGNVFSVINGPSARSGLWLGIGVLEFVVACLIVGFYRPKVI